MVDLVIYSAVLAVIPLALGVGLDLAAGLAAAGARILGSGRAS